MTNFDKFKTYCRKFCVQTRLAVRISLSITAITTFATQAAAQNNPQEIRLDFNDAALSQVLKSIETQSRYTFFYNNEIDVTQSVSADIASSDINSVVTAVLKGTDIAHRITDNRVVLFVGGGDAADDQERSISGKVTDAAGLPLVGVTVLVTGTNFAAVTDVNAAIRSEFRAAEPKSSTPISAIRASSGSSARRRSSTLRCRKAPQRSARSW